jgi:hypothetical protein
MYEKMDRKNNVLSATNMHGKNVVHNILISTDEKRVKIK